MTAKVLRLPPMRPRQESGISLVGDHTSHEDAGDHTSREDASEEPAALADAASDKVRAHVVANQARAIPVPPVSESRPIDRHSSFQVLYREHADYVSRTLSRQGVSASEIPDLLQEVFIVAHRRFAEFEERGFGPRSWLGQIARYVASDARRYKRRHPEDPADDISDYFDAAGIDPSDLREAQALLERILSRMTPEKRDVFRLYEIEGLRAPEIAERLGIPLNTVYSRLRLARLDFEDLLLIIAPRE